MSKDKPSSDDSTSSKLAKKVANYLKEKGKERLGQFFTNDGTLTQYFAHGATELANVIVHGHPAPMYAAHATVPDLYSADTETPTSETGKPSLIDKHLADIGVSKTNEPEPAAPSNAPEVESLIDEHLPDTTHASHEPQQPEMEIDQ